MKQDDGFVSGDGTEGKRTFLNGLVGRSHETKKTMLDYISSKLTYMREVSRSNRLSRTNFLPKLIWNQKVGLEECPYLHRTVLDFGPFAIRLHKWLGSDDRRAFHDHPWWFLTLVLYGSYADISEYEIDILKFGSIRFRPANHKHTVEVHVRGTWTILITGKPMRRWGFWVKGKLIKRDKYFAVHGHHPCEGMETPVRRRPDGERI